MQHNESVKHVAQTFAAKYGVFPPALRPKDAAPYIGVSVAQLNRLVAAGKLKPVKPSPAVTLFKTTDLDAYLAELFGEG
ncbi:helix-turn-helix transcriptional regulator [Chitinilyticum litopenaei]|uniref:helix-turn-helix transcriptional regulator n=1 Tax=Chitinilyticum litopenaei TaxID=1121276 RepID=UPI0003F7DEF0|nr:helix-turn-helix domain-containing protein [Chitinilyticum litopenaei]